MQLQLNRDMVLLVDASLRRVPPAAGPIATALRQGIDNCGDVKQQRPPTQVHI
jgi:hypothetical protein